MKKKINYVRECIFKEYLNHLGDDFLKRRYDFTGLMINKLIKCYLGLFLLMTETVTLINVLKHLVIFCGNLTYQCVA